MQNRARIAVLLYPLCCCFLIGITATQVRGQEREQSSIPLGWWVYPAEKLQHVDHNTRSCFNYSRNEWQVFSKPAGIQIAPLHVEGKGPSSTDELPSGLKLEPGMPGRNVRAGLRKAMRFGDAWLLAYDAGEWGGGLWLTNKDGAEAKRIIGDNVRALIPIGDKLVVLSGFAHMSLDYGTAYIFSNPTGTGINLDHSIHLDGEPSGYAVDKDSSILFTTTRGVKRLNTQGELTTLTYLPEWVSGQYPNSVAVASDGSIFVGMRMFVLRLHKRDEGYKEEWLLPEKCKRFELARLDCICHDK